ncbi:MAG: long-chain fatty acid--CoA ligase [Pseudomonadota bacterium]
MDDTQAIDPFGQHAPDMPWLQAYPANVPWETAYTPCPLHQILDDAVAKFPNRPCATFLGRTETYADIGAAVERAAAALAGLDVGPGTRVGLMLPNCPTFIVYYFATLKLGGVVVNYNPLYSLDELTEQVRDSGTDLMVTLDLKVLFEKTETLIQNETLPRALVGSFAGLLPPLKATLFRLLKGGDLANVKSSPVRGRIVLEADALKAGKPYTAADIDPEQDIAVLQYTGGTTGTPKGAMLTHANLSVNTMQVASWAPDLTEGEERVLGALPFFHVFAMTVVMNYAILRGAEIVMMPRFVLDDALKLITKHKPTVMPGVPTMYNAMMNHPKLASFDLSSLKFCLSGGAALPLDVKRQFEKLTGCTLVEGYGLSETSPVATANPIGGPVKESSIGLPLPQTRISLRDLDDPIKVVPDGERGEICIAGPQVMKGYWNNEAATEAAFVGAYFRTGDVAVMDDEGFFYIVDRIKDLIICSGFNVYPRRIEEAIQEFPPVDEVTVIGVPDDYRGESPKAFVKLRDGQAATADELMAFLEPKLSKIEMPSAIEFRDELPKTMIGKLSKKELKQEEAEKAGAASTEPA